MTLLSSRVRKLEKIAMPVDADGGYVAMVTAGSQSDDEVKAVVLNAYAERGVFDASDCFIIKLTGVGPDASERPIEISHLGMRAGTA